MNNGISIITSFGCPFDCWFCIMKQHSLYNYKGNFDYNKLEEFLKEHKDTNEILKFGETLNPEKRYSQKSLNENNAVMKVIESGSKRDIHMWQYDMNKYYESKYGEFPPLLKSKGW